ncbi:MAG: hypothetical protein NTX45_07720 [Proteobacteria bacterium]|nr:hypothetical protein [Pseudomonadota bacterium]
MLDDESGVPIFARNGKHLSEITDVGKLIVAIAGEIPGCAQDIKKIAQDHFAFPHPHLTQDIIHAALGLRERHEAEELFKQIPLPVR